MVVASAVIKPSESRAWARNHPENLLAALRSSVKEKDVIEIIASSGARILFNKKLLLLFSRTIRKCLADLPCCEPPSSITLVDINIRSLKKVKEILENNLHDVTTEFSQEDIEEVVEAAKALGIEMTNVKLSSTRRKTKKKRKKSISSDSLARYSLERSANMEPDLVQLEDEPVMENETPGSNKEELDMDYDDERPLEISVDISSDEEDQDNEDQDDDDTREYGPEATFLQRPQNTLLQASDETKLLRDYPTNTDEDESLQEESKPESEKISFSFLSGIDSTNTSTEIPKRSLLGAKKEHTEDTTMSTMMIEDGSAVFKDHFMSGLSGETEPLPSGSSSEAAAEAESEFKLRCDLCGKPQKGPSALREHYSITHFFEELFQEYVVPTESHTVCRMDGCDKDYRDRKCLVRHIGSTHNKIMPILERNGIKIPTTGGGTGGSKRRKSENFAEARSVKIKMEQTEIADNANKSLSRIHQCELCEKYFSSKHNMERHQKKIHNMPGAGAASGSQLVKEESG